MGGLTSPADSGRRSWSAVTGAVLWFGAGIAFLAAEALTARAFRGRYSYAHNYISDLGRPAESPWSDLMNTAFCLQGTAFVVGAGLLVWALQRPRATVFLIMAAFNAAGNVVVAVVHSGPASPGDMSWAHGVGAALAIVGGNLAILAGAQVLRRAGAPRWYRVVSPTLAVLGLTSLLVLGLSSSTPAVSHLDGVWERGSVYSIIVWQVLSSIYLLCRLSQRQVALATDESAVSRPTT